MKRILVLAVLLPLFACGDDSTGIDVDLNGNWQLTHSNITGSYIGITVSCTVTPATFTVTQTGETFTGTQTGSAQLNCSAGAAGSVQQSLSGYGIENGQITGSNIMFGIRSSASPNIQGQNTGTVSGATMTGTTQWNVQFGTISVTLNGQFAGQKS